MLEATDRSSLEIQLGERLRRARELAGFAQGEAAIALGITSAALSQYEGGKRRIEALTLDRIARLYGVSITYFFADAQTDKQTDWEIALRSLANSLSAAGKAGVAKLIQRIHDLEHLYAVSGLSFPGKPHPPFPSLPKESYADYRVAEFAQKVRRYYNLGIAPLLNVKLFLDAQGYQVFGIPFGKDEPVSGLFFLHPQLGAIIVFNEDQAYAREPFTLCHEMAHSLFHWDRPAILCRDSGADLIEDFANRFASYFLIPRDGLQERLDVLGIKTVKQPEEVIHIARYFGVSYEVTLHSLDMERKLGVPRESLKTDVKPIALAKTLGYKPLPYEFGVRPLPLEERLPRIFLELGYRAIDKGILSLRRVAEMIGISDLELEERLDSGEVEEMEDVYI